LGVASASLYHHFHNKDEVLQAVCRLIFREIPLPDDRTERWPDFMERTAFNARNVMLRHPNALPLMARFTPRQVIPHIYERFGGLLLKRGVPVDMVSVIMNAFDILVIGSATLKLARGQLTAGRSAAQGLSSLADWERANPRSEEDVFRLMCRELGHGLNSPATAPGVSHGRVGR
jgi:AcrR family transcriptional regulator